VGGLTHSHPAEPIKLCSQSTSGVRLCCAFIHPEQSRALMLGQNPFAGMFLDVSSSNYKSWGHVMGTNRLLGPLDKKAFNIIGINITESRTLWQV
jgi:hypothetical protein